MRRCRCFALHDSADDLLTRVANVQGMSRSELIESALCMYVLTARDPDGPLGELFSAAEDLYSESHGFYDGPEYGKERARKEDELLRQIVVVLDRVTSLPPYNRDWLLSLHWSDQPPINDPPF